MVRKESVSYTLVVVNTLILGPILVSFLEPLKCKTEKFAILLLLGSSSCFFLANVASKAAAFLCGHSSKMSNENRKTNAVAVYLLYYTRRQKGDITREIRLRITPSVALTTNKYYISFTNRSPF